MNTELVAGLQEDCLVWRRLATRHQQDLRTRRGLQIKCWHSSAYPHQRCSSEGCDQLPTPGGAHISDDLTWMTICSKLFKKAHITTVSWRLKMLHLSSVTLTSFYRCSMESILTVLQSDTELFCQTEAGEYFPTHFMPLRMSAGNIRITHSFPVEGPKPQDSGTAFPPQLSLLMLHSLIVIIIIIMHIRLDANCILLPWTRDVQQQ